MKLFFLCLGLTTVCLFCGCDILGERMSFDVTLSDTILNICTHIDLSANETAQIEAACIETYGRSVSGSYTITASTSEIWSARSLSDIITIIRRGGTK